MKKNNITVKEIAKKAGVSVSTVSRVISGTDTAIPISEKTRKKVLAVCEELKFLPDVNYTRLQERRSYIIAFLIPRIHVDSQEMFRFDENVGAFMSSFEEELAKRKYSILIQGVDEEYIESRQYLKILRNNTADGLVIWDAFPRGEPIELLKQEIRPSIAVAFPYTEAENFIIPDNTQGAYDMTQHLLKQGHRSIAYISGGKGEVVDQLRESGYRKAMGEEGLEVIILNGGYNYSGGFECGTKIIEEHKNVTAIFAANDLMATGAMKSAKAKGLSIPQDLAVAGFDGSNHSEVVTPNITTGRLNLYEIGKLAAINIVEMIEGKNDGPVQITLPIEILERGSTVAEN